MSAFPLRISSKYLNRRTTEFWYKKRKQQQRHNILTHSKLFKKTVPHSSSIFNPNANLEFINCDCYSKKQSEVRSLTNNNYSRSGSSETIKKILYAYKSHEKYNVYRP